MGNRVQALAKINFLKIRGVKLTNEKEADPVGSSARSGCPSALSFLLSRGSRIDPGRAQPRRARQDDEEPAACGCLRGQRPPSALSGPVPDVGTRTLAL